MRLHCARASRPTDPLSKSAPTPTTSKYHVVKSDPIFSLFTSFFSSSFFPIHGRSAEKEEEKSSEAFSGGRWWNAQLLCRETDLLSPGIQKEREREIRRHTRFLICTPWGGTLHTHSTTFLFVLGNSLSSVVKKKDDGEKKMYNNK